MSGSSGSKRCISVLNLITMLLSVPVVGSGFWLASKHHSECTRFLETPILCIGILMLVLSMAGFVGSCWGVRCLLWVYLFLLFLLILSLLGFTTFALVVTSNELGGTDQELEMAQTYKLDAYSGWLLHHVQNGHNWIRIKSCLSDARVCGSTSSTILPTFLYAHLNPLQMGCCKPPAVCEFEYLPDGTPDESQPPLNATATPDCQLWSNDATELCLECSTCKAGLLANLRRDWSKVAIFNVALLGFLLLVYALAVCVFQSATKQSRARRRAAAAFRPVDCPNLPVTNPNPNKANL